MRLLNQLVKSSGSKQSSRSRRTGAGSKLFETLETRRLMTTFYVSNAGNDGSANPSSVSSPLASISHAQDLASPGDTIVVRAGNYPGIYNNQRNGLTYTNYPGERPVLVASYGQDGAYVENSRNVTIRGFEVISQGGIYTPGIEFYANCVNCTASDNVIHGFGGAGISTYNPTIDGTVYYGGLNTSGNPVAFNSGADYITITNNVIYGNCNTHTGSTSGISFYGFTNSDGTGGYHSVIRGNTIYDNIETHSSRHTDGNGVIVDLGGDTMPGVLIENNVIFRNGGRAVNVYKSSNVLIRNNSSYQNSRDPYLQGGKSELFVERGKNVTFANNVAYGNGNELSHAAELTGAVQFVNNLYFNGTISIAGTGDVYADPLYVNPGSGNLNVQSNSPAIDTGSTSYNSAIDFTGVSRPQGAGPDRGAYELAGTPTPTPGSGVTVFDEAFSADWSGAGWNGTFDYASTDRARTGSRSIKATFTSAYGAFGAQWSTNLSTTNVTSVSASVYNAATSDKAMCVLTFDAAGNMSGRKNFTAFAGQWTDVVATLAELGSPANIMQVLIHDQSNSTYMAYVDNLKVNTSTTVPTPGSTTLVGDAPAPGWNGAGWGGTFDYASTDRARSGSKSIKAVFTGGFGAVGVSSGTNVSTSNIASISTSVFNASSTDKLMCILTFDTAGNMSGRKTFTAVAGQWTDVTATLAELGNPTNVAQVFIHDQSSSAYTVYVDEIKLTYV